MKTLIIALEYPPQIGGVASYVYNLAKNMPGEDVVVYAPKIAGGADFDKKNSWKVVRGKPYFLFFWPRWIKMLIEIWDLVEKEKIKMIYVHHALPAGYVAYLLKKFKHIPYIVFFHGTDLNLALKTKKNKLKKVCLGAEKIVVNSNFLKNQFTKNFEDLKKEITIIYPCPDSVFLDKVPEMEYVFCDTGKELPETYEYLSRVEAFLGKKIIVLNDRAGFDHWLKVFDGFLPAPNMRWCTKLLKLNAKAEISRGINGLAIRGAVMRKKLVSGPAPAIAEASYKSAGTDLIRPVQSTMTKG